MVTDFQIVLSEDACWILKFRNIQGEKDDAGYRVTMSSSSDCFLIEVYRPSLAVCIDVEGQNPETINLLQMQVKKILIQLLRDGCNQLLPAQIQANQNI